jgi:hypothetical protein
MTICKLTLADGNWGRKLKKESVEATLRHYSFCGDCKVSHYEFLDPDEDNAFEIEVVVTTDWSGDDNVQDSLTECFIRRFDPEFESMVEVELY